MSYAAPHSPSVTILTDMLTYMRPAGSRTEQAFIDKFIAPTGAQPDKFGNYWLDVGPDAPTVLFSSHTDTVHHDEGTQEIRIVAGIITAVVTRVPVERTPRELEKAMEQFTLDGIWPEPQTRKSTNCLGADCTTGVWLMLEMIANGVPGRYVFHREEECGGHGSSHVAKNEPERLEGIKAAIAFDRKGYYDIITEQWGGKCASDEFAVSLAAVLDMPDMKPDPTGSFTDTANYTHLVPECTNISVGYFGQHGPKEEQDLEFAVMLRDHLLVADWSKLVIKRDPADDPYGWEEDDVYEGRYGGYVPKKKAKTRSSLQDKYELEELEWMVNNYPQEFARWLHDAGFDASQLADEIGVEY